MPPSPRVVLANLALIAASLVFALLAAELVVFRFILLPSDVPRNAFTDGVVRYAPQQTGITRLRNEFAAPFAINAQGWNSGVGDYRLARTPGVARIAIVGDSMVEAMQVAASASLAEQLGRRLGEAAEVYRFAISGAPLSQYLWMIEREVARYTPDLVVVVLIHNDFDESFRFKPGRYTSSFLKLKIEDGQVTDEIPPTAYEPPWWDGLRFSATFRYLYYRQRACPEALCGRDVASPFQANVDADVVARARADVRIATEYVFARLTRLARDAGFRLLLMMDGDRKAVYAGADPGPLYAGGPLALNALAAEAAARNGIAFIDLHARFAADWQAHHKGFDFPHDSHWNERGHEIAAEAIAEFVRQ